MRQVVEKSNSLSWMERHFKVYSQNGKLLGEIQELHLGHSASLGGEPTVYLSSQHGRNYGTKCCDTLMQAYLYLGCSTKQIAEMFEEEFKEEYLYDKNGNKIACVGPQDW